jgi:hypothetical protein
MMNMSRFLKMLPKTYLFFPTAVQMMIDESDERRNG